MSSAGNSALPVFRERLPGIAVCAALSAAAVAIRELERLAFGHAYVDAVVLAIVSGIAVRTAWEPSRRWRPGIVFSGKTLLEVAIILFGASISLQVMVASGATLLLAVAATVILSLGASYGIARLLALPHRMAVLIACGNSICGNSAIAAVAPVIGATREEVASSIAYTAILGVGVVLLLPLLASPGGLSQAEYGLVAGLTVYAVPQVLAATLPVGLVSVQIGTFVKLVRVMMLGPLVVGASLGRRSGTGSRSSDGRRRVPLVPWFVAGFLALAAARSLGLVPDAAVAPAQSLASLLTVVAMAALGLEVDVRVLGRVGGRVTLAVVGSLLVLLAISLALTRLVPVTAIPA